MIIGLSMKEREQLVTFNRLKGGEISQAAAAKILSYSIRWIRKKYKRFLKEGDKGLVHRSRGRPSPNSWNQEQKEFAMVLFKESFRNFGPTFAAEKLEELYNIKVSKETMRTSMIEYGYWKASVKKPKYRKQRERKEFFGEMIQLDGSPHDWFEGRYKNYTLLVFIDDATSKIPFMKFVPSESNKSVMLALRDYVEHHGRPLSLYVDFGGVFSVNMNNPDRDKVTQFERACSELRIEVIHAHSPQAKGRVERSNRTHQDRLIKELRLAEISTPEHANEFIEKVYLPKHNNRYAKPASKKGNVHRSIKNYNLNAIFCRKEERTVQNDFTLRYKKRVIQLTNEQKAVPRPKEKVVISEHFDGSLTLSIRNIPLDFIEIRSFKSVIVNEPKKVHEKHFKPALDHPWRRGYKGIPPTILN